MQNSVFAHMRVLMHSQLTNLLQPACHIMSNPAAVTSGHLTLC